MTKINELNKKIAALENEIQALKAEKSELEAAELLKENLEVAAQGSELREISFLRNGKIVKMEVLVSWDRYNPAKILKADGSKFFGSIGYLSNDATKILKHSGLSKVSEVSGLENLALNTRGPAWVSERYN